MLTFRDKFTPCSRDEDIKFIVGQLGWGTGLELGVPATPWDREYESHKGVEVGGALNSQVKLEKQNKLVKDFTVWRVGRICL